MSLGTGWGHSGGAIESDHSEIQKTFNLARRFLQKGGWPTSMDPQANLEVLAAVVYTAVIAVLNHPSFVHSLGIGRCQRDTASCSRMASRSLA